MTKTILSNNELGTLEDWQDFLEGHFEDELDNTSEDEKWEAINSINYEYIEDER